MLQGLRQLDQILRGEVTRPKSLRSGIVGIEIVELWPVLLILAAVYGFFMSWYGLFNRDWLEYRYAVAAVVKTPALFGLTLLVTLPSLYVFNALFGSRLGFQALVKLLLASLGVTVAILASFGPIVAFFSATTDSYPFMILLNVAFFAVSGALGLMFLLQTLHRLAMNSLDPVDVQEAAAPAATPIVRLDDRPISRNVKILFQCWIVIFGLVGAQMSWVLRPFIGNPVNPFEWFRPRYSNFFEAVWTSCRNLFL